MFQKLSTLIKALSGIELAFHVEICKKHFGICSLDNFGSALLLKKQLLKRNL